MPDETSPDEATPTDDFEPTPAEAAPASEPESVDPPKQPLIPTVVKPAIPPPLYKGRGMLIAGGLFGVVGVIVKTVGTFQALKALRSRDPMAPSGTDVIVAYSSVYNPMIGLGLGLIGGGLGQRGEWDAHHELFDSAAAEPLMKRARPKLGWGLFGGGAGLWAVTRLLALACKTDQCAVATLELGYYPSLALTAPGVALGAWGSGHNNYVKRFGHLENVSVTPLAGANWGAAVSARF